MSSFQHRSLLLLLHLRLYYVVTKFLGYLAVILCVEVLLGTGNVLLQLKSIKDLIQKSY